jgi:hypothetical protein
MPFDKQHRFPKAGASPQDRQIKLGGDPESFETQTLAWQFHCMDIPHAKWGWHSVDLAVWRKILKQLQDFERMTWAAIKETAGGRTRGTNNHSLKITELNAAARARINELHLDQYDKIFSLRLGSKIRIYGVRDGRAMRLIWYDTHHGTFDAVCPTKGDKAG